MDRYHGDRRNKLGKSSRCKDCDRERQRLYRATTDYEKRRYKKNAAKERERHLKKKYGVTLATYAVMLEAQERKCAICGVAPGPALNVDHCHVSGYVRGLLCPECNRMLGCARDSADTLRRAAVYLEKHRSLQPAVNDA